jgi:hypothetical protein
MKHILFALTFILVSCTASISVKADPDIYVEPLAPNTLSPKKDKSGDIDAGEYLKNRIAPKRNPTQQIMVIACDTSDYVQSQVLTQYKEKKLFGGITVIMMLPSGAPISEAQRFSPTASLYVNQDTGTWSLIAETGNYSCLIANGAQFSPGE